MWRWNKNQQIDDAGLQRIEAEVFRALEASPAEIETAANSPFLYRRLRVAIEAETRRRAWWCRAQPRDSPAWPGVDNRREQAGGIPRTEQPFVSAACQRLGRPAAGG